MTSRTQQHNAFQRGMTVQELKLRVKAGTARNAFVRKAAKTYEATGHLPAHLLVAHQDRLRDALTGHYTQTAEYFGRLALSTIRKGRKSSLTPVQALIAEWVKRESLRKAKMIADTDRDEVIGAIASGLKEGLGTAEIATGIRRLTGMTPYRASVIARTETHAAATYGSIESVRDAEEQLDVQMLKAWLPTGDDRTRPEHLAMRGHPAIPLNEKFVVGGEEMDRPGDPSASAGNLVNCLHPDSLIESGHIKAMTRHWYEGKLVTIETASGKRLSVTPNHPILTRKGWVAAATLKEGGSVICGTGFERVRLGDLDIEDIKATAEQMFDALDIFRTAVRVANVRVNFHGEMPDRDVDVVDAAGELRNRGESLLLKPLDHLRLACTDVCQGRLLANGLLYGVRMAEFWRLIPDRFVRLGRKSKAILLRSFRHAGKHAFAAIAMLDAMVFQAKIDVVAVGIVCRRERFDRFALDKPLGDLSADSGSFGLGGNPPSVALPPHGDAGFMKPAIDRHDGNAPVRSYLNGTLARKVFEDEIVSIDQASYRGFVYNAETNNGYYISNGIVQHNCRCSLVYAEAE